MKQLLLLFFLAQMSICFAQDISETVYTNYDAAIAKAELEKKPLFIYLDKKPELFYGKIIQNDTVRTMLSKEFISLFLPNGKDKRQLIKQYDAKNVPMLVLNSDGTLYHKVEENELKALLEQLKEIAPGTYHYFTDEFREQFIQNDSTQIFDAIQSVFINSSTANTRKLTMDYLKQQSSLLTPINYQLIKTLMPTGDEELINRLASEMRPEMYTREMAEKVAYELLTLNGSSVQKTKQQIEQYGIPYQEQVDRYLAVATSSSFRDKKENCLQFVLDASTSDYSTLRECFYYILRNSNKNQLKEVEQKYMFTMNEVDINRSLVMADLLADLMLTKGDLKTFQILKKRNENIRKKYLIP